jgi:cation-transporting ATPase E
VAEATTAPAPIGLSSEEARARLRARPERPRRPRGSRSVTEIIWSNTFTVFNLVLGSLLAVTLAFGDPRDALFGGVIIANTLIGIIQELRAKRTLDRLALLVAPRARTWRDGEQVPLPVSDLVEGDVVHIEPGDQVIADGPLVDARALALDESFLTGEGDPVARDRGEKVLSGAFCVSGAGDYEVAALGDDSYAGKLAAEARGTRAQLSPLQEDINRILRWTVWVMAPLGVSLIAFKAAGDEPVQEIVSEVVAALVPIVPEGLFLLTSITFAIAAINLGRLGTLAQRLNAVESLASVDTVCLDKTGTLTDNKLTVATLESAPARTADDLGSDVGALAASVASRNATMQAILDGYPADEREVLAEVPFTSARKWSGATMADVGTVVMGAPDVLARLGVEIPDELAGSIAEQQEHRRRVVLIAQGATPLDPETEALPPDLEAAGAIALAEGLREEAVDAVGYLTAQGVESKVISGDGLKTVQAVAMAAGIPRADLGIEGPSLPDDPDSLDPIAERTGVFARVAPEQKRTLVRSLTRMGRYVGMVGDGVNDTLALKESRLGIAMGNGSQMAKGVADIVLLTNSFATVPVAVEEGRRIIRNTHRVAKLFVAKSVTGALYLLIFGFSEIAFPFLARQITVVGSLAIGIPAFFLAVTPSSGRVQREGFFRSLLAFTVPAGTIVALVVSVAYVAALFPLDLNVEEGRTIATLLATFLGLMILLQVERGVEGRRVRSWVWGMAGLLAGTLVVGLYVPFLQDFFAVSEPSGIGWLAVLIGTAVGVGLLVLQRHIPVLRRLEAEGS